MAERIQIIVSESGSRTVRRNIRGIGGDASQASLGVGALRTALLGLGGTVVVRQFIQISDSLTQVQNRLGLVTKSQAELNEVTRELFRVANDTRSAFEATAEVYARTALSARNLGVTQREVLDFTKALNQAIILSGASAQEARNGVIQFSQGLASNRLAGDELRAVLEQLPLVADIIAKRLGVTRGALRDLAAQGKITGQTILEAFGPEAQREIQAAFEKTNVTISQAFTVLENELTRFIGDFNKASGLASGFAKVILVVANNFEFFGRVVLAGIVTGAILGVVAAFNFLTAAIAANPIGALVVGLTAGVAALVAFSDQIKVSSDGFVTLQDVGIAVLQEIGIAFGAFAEVAGAAIGEITKVFGSITDNSKATFGDVIAGAAAIVDGVVGVFVGLGFAIVEAFRTPRAAIFDIIIQIVNFIIEKIESIVDVVQAVVGTVTDTLFALSTRLSVAFTSLTESVRQAAAGNSAEAARFAEQAIFQMEQAVAEGTRRIPGAFERNLDQARMVQTIQKVFNPFEGEALTAGQKVANAFVEGFESTTGLSDLVNNVRTRLAGIGAQRQAESLQGADLNTGVEGDTGGLTQQQQAIKDLTEALQRRGEVLMQNIGLTQQEISVRDELFKIEERFKAQAVELTEEQRNQIRSTLEQNQAFETQVEIYNRLNGSAEQARFEMEQLKALFDQGKISVEQFTAELTKLRIQELEGSRDAFAGFERGLLKLQDRVTDFATQSEQLITNAFDSASEAFVDFVRTGEFNFSKLIDSILNQLIKLAFQQALLGLIGAFATGGASTAVSGAAGAAGAAGARASGGPVQSGRPFLVGEEGPELFVPNRSGQILSNSDTNAAMAGSGGSAPTPVNVTVINVTDPNEIPAAMSGAEGTEVIINAISSNPDAIKGVLA